MNPKGTQHLRQVRRAAAGFNTPVDDLKSLIREKQPDVVALSVASVLNLDKLVSAAAEIRAAFPEVPILVGGQAFRWGGREQVEGLPQVQCLTGLSELEAWIQANNPNHV